MKSKLLKLSKVATTKSLYVLLLLVITIAFSCNKDDWWDKLKNGGSGTNSGCIDKTKIKPYKICRKVDDPVCGCDGKTYANPCEADKNGVMKYTKGKCKPKDDGGTNNGCFDKSKYNPNAPCPRDYTPVCGCDGKEYANPCDAERHGIIKYTKGKCNPNGGGGSNDGCFDKSKYNPNAPCTKELNPVCGCDGKEYMNPCDAERNGIIKYTMGKCKTSGGDGTNTGCIDKNKINPNAYCPTMEKPVCGCDGKDYANPCEADKNGVLKYTAGKCQR